MSVFGRSGHGIEYIVSLSYCNNVVECCSLKVKIMNEELVIVGIYRPHSGTVSDFVSELI